MWILSVDRQPKTTWLGAAILGKVQEVRYSNSISGNSTLRHLMVTSRPNQGKLITASSRLPLGFHSLLASALEYSARRLKDRRRGFMHLRVQMLGCLFSQLPKRGGGKQQR